MTEIAAKTVGLRERKRAETLRRIAEVSLNLFVAKGYEGTTLDDIAEAAGISRRTFFYYFDGKDEILTAYVDGFVAELKGLVVECASMGSPLDIACAALSKLVTPHEHEMLATTRIMAQSPSLRARNRGKYFLLEEAMFDGFREISSSEKEHEQSRFIAMMSIGALRFAVEAWVREDGKSPLAGHVQDMFEKLKHAIAHGRL